MKRIVQTAAVALPAAVASVLAQAPGVQRTVVYKADVSVPGREAVIARVELAPGASAGGGPAPVCAGGPAAPWGGGPHVVMEGEGDIIIEGQPTRKVKAGDGFVIPAGAIHDAHNTGSTPLKLAGIYVVDKGKPLATPAK